MMTTEETDSLTTGQLATLACVLEVSIPKPGNVHRAADFADTTFQDFLISAVAIGPAMQSAAHVPLGDTILDAIRATRQLVKVNTNLGMVLLLGPLAAAEAPDESSIRELLHRATPQDCQKIYQAISICRPGGLGTSKQNDVHSMEVPSHIVDAMQIAADRDMIAKQYVSGFSDVLSFVLPVIEDRLGQGCDLTAAVIHAHVKTMQKFPDSLIARKNGKDLARQSAAMAADVLSSGRPGDVSYIKALGNLDFWLRSDGNRRNPGTTADLIAAALFAGFRRGSIDFTGMGN